MRSDCGGENDRETFDVRCFDLMLRRLAKYINSKYLGVSGAKDGVTREIEGEGEREVPLVASRASVRQSDAESDVGLISWITSIVSSLKMQFRARDDVKTDDDFKR